jgi:YggT family protein
MFWLILVNIIHRIIQLITLLVVANALLSFFMDPFHPLRQTLDRFVDPMLAPIRRLLPPMVGLDFSPLVLIIVLQVIDSVLTTLLLRL